MIENTTGRADAAIRSIQFSNANIHIRSSAKGDHIIAIGALNMAPTFYWVVSNLESDNTVAICRNGRQHHRDGHTCRD